MMMLVVVVMVVHFEPLMRREVVGLVNQCPSRLQCLCQIGFLAMWNQTPFHQSQKVILQINYTINKNNRKIRTLQRKNERG